MLDWQRAFDAGLQTCGGKGYHLARLSRYDFPVPDGGVVVADVYRHLMPAPVLATQRAAWLQCNPPAVVIAGGDKASLAPAHTPPAACDGQVWYGRSTLFADRKFKALLHR